MNIRENLKNLANEGDGFACFQLGKAYMDGKHSLLKDTQQGLFWYEKGAKTHNNGLCLYCLANIYTNGKLGFIDKEKANHYYKLAFPKLMQESKKEEKNALFYLGYYYFFGLTNVEIDYNNAFLLWKRSAELGKATAQSNTGFMYYYGFGTEKNLASALYWYELSARENIPNANLMIRIIKDELYNNTK